MAARSKIATLPTAVREWLEKALVENGFAQYEQLEKLLEEKGYFIGKSTIQRYGSKLQQRMDAVRASSQAAILLAQSTGDDVDSMSRATTSLLQSQFFDVLVNLQDLDEGADPSKRAALLAKLSVGIADINRASLNLKKWELAIREKAAAAAEKVDRIAKKGGLSQKAADEIRREILGIAS